ncbi:MAG: reverse transcriptase [Gemmatales bacterium]|nr:MAG: reverse transcriptase [Gemmatales bacterium]
MGFFSWLKKLFGMEERPAPGRQKPAVHRTFDLDPGDFAPISRSEFKRGLQATADQESWFDRGNIIPPADDPRTRLIDRALVTHGLLSPEQLAEIHQAGAEMERVRAVLSQIEEQAVLAGEAEVEKERERKRLLKEQKKADAERRKQQRAEAVAKRRATDIIYLGRGVSHRLNDRHSDVDRLRRSHLPMLSTPADLASALELTVPRLRWLAFHTEAATRIHYVQFRVPKKSGGQRTLSAPHKTLARVQRWILDNILCRLEIESSAHGFVRGRSILTNAYAHAGRDVVINADLEDFFPSISFFRVRNVFQRTGYSGAVATILALLCTECPRRIVQYEGQTYYVATGPRGLPQGACTSPTLSNIVSRRLDRRLAGLARKFNLQYSRYADDLTWSGSLPLPVTNGNPAPQKAPHKKGVGYFLARVRHIAEEEGFHIHPAKTRVLRRHAAQLVTGLVVNVRPNVPRKEIRRIRAILHHARHEGLEAQNREQHPNFRSWLAGKIAYISMVRPDVGAKLAAQFRQLS